MWQLGSSSPNFTLEGHEKGVNSIDYYSGGDKPYLISGADDRLVKIWDYQVYHIISKPFGGDRKYLDMLGFLTENWIYGYVLLFS